MRVVAAGAALLAAAFATVLSAQSERVVRELRGAVHGVGDARVRVTVLHNDMARSTVEPLAEGLAAADGTFVFRDVPWFTRQTWGMNTVVVVARAARRVGVLEVRGDEAAIDRLQVNLGDAIDLHGLVRSRVSGKPIADACIWPAIFGANPQGRSAVWVTAPMLPWRATTDAEGRFTLKDLPPLGPMQLIADGNEHARSWVVIDDLRQPVEVELEIGGRIRGTVLLPDGRPAVRALVRTAGSGAGYGHATTDDDGRFCLTSLSADVYKVWAEVPDLTVIAVHGLAITPGAIVENQTVQLVRGGFIAGRIIDAATGTPISPGPNTDVAMYGPARPDGGACECTPVLPDGTFRIRAPAGRNNIYLRGAVGWTEPSEDVVVVEGEETKVEWRLRRGRAK